MDKDRDKVSKASFILYNSYRAMVNKLSDEDAGALMKAIFALAAGEEDADSDLSYGAGIVYAGIAQQMAVDEKKYNNRCENNRKSAAARWNEKKSAQEAAEAKTAAQDDAADQEPEKEDSAEMESDAPNAPEVENVCESIPEDANKSNCMRSDANAHDNDNEYDNDLKEKDSFGVSKESVSASPQPAVAIPLKDGSLYSIPESDLKEYLALYPGLDVVHECQKAARWCRDNPARQKTRQGVKRFLGSWLSRAAADHARNGTSPVQNGIAAPKPNRFHNFDQRGTDYDALMRIVN